jgi:outer membrane protein OmpA-like peptidoglycan-associated protein
MSSSFFTVNTFDLHQYQLDVAEVHHNLPPSSLYEQAIRCDKDASIAAIRACRAGLFGHRYGIRDGRAGRRGKPKHLATARSGARPFCSYSPHWGAGCAGQKKSSVTVAIVICRGIRERRETIMFRYSLRVASLSIQALVMLIAMSCIASAQTVKVKGLIQARSGATMIVQVPDSPNINVVLTDYTQVGQIQGVLKARRKQMSMAALIPGLMIEAEGTYNEQHELVAKSVKFKGDDLQQAKSVQAGLHETQERSRQNTAELAKQNAALAAQNEALKQQQEDLKHQQEELTVQQKKVAANKAAIDAAIARFGQLDDYYILDQVTVYFANGKVNLEQKYKPDLTQLATKAKTVNAYMIEVKGYASSVGSTTLNQKLSEDRAHNVTSFLIQQGHIPLTNMLSPGAMGESQQVGNDRTAEGQAENRRVVVRVLQNKGVAGL